MLTRSSSSRKRRASQTISKPPPEFPEERPPPRIRRASVAVSGSVPVLAPSSRSPRNSISGPTTHLTPSGSRNARGRLFIEDSVDRRPHKSDSFLHPCKPYTETYINVENDLLAPPLPGTRSARGSFSHPSSSEMKMALAASSGSRSARASFSVPSSDVNEFKSVLERTCRISHEPNETKMVISRSPRGSLVPAEFNRSPRGSLGPEFNRSPRTSPRSSLPDTGGAYLSSRGSPTSTDVLQTGFSRATSFEMDAAGFVGIPKGTSRAPRGIINATESRRESSSVASQVSADDRRQLCETTKLQSETKSAVYGSVVYQLKDANVEASGSCDFTLRALWIIFRTGPVTIILVCLTTVPIIMFIMGVNYFRDCPREPNLPLYMVVGGSFGFIEMLLLVLKQVRSRTYESLTPGYEETSLAAEANVVSHVMLTLLSAFLVVWSIMGGYWTLRIFYPAFEPTSLYEPNAWCAKPLYIFSLAHLVVLLTVVAGIFGLILVLCCCYLFSCPLVVRYT